MTHSKRFDDYDPRAWLERSGLLCLKHLAYSASIECFMRLVKIEPNYSMAWYGLSAAAYSASGSTRNLDLLRQSVAVLKHCLVVDPDNTFASKFYDAIPNQTPLTESDLLSIEASSQLKMPPELAFNTNSFAECLPTIPDAGERMQLIMWLGTFDNESSTELLLAGLQDSDAGVVRATLKRLVSKNQDERIPSVLDGMHSSGSYLNYEPYFSMAARRFGLPFASAGNFPPDGR